jgi:hypothetical protein
MKWWLLLVVLFCVGSASAVPGWVQINVTDSFTSSANGWTGGTLDTGSGLYNLTSGFGTVRKNYTFTNSTYELVNITIGKFWYVDGANDPKFFIYGTASDNDYELLDGTQASQSWKEVTDGGGFGSDSCSAEVWVNATPITYTWNKTSREWKVYHGGKLCSTATSAALAGSDNLEITSGNGALAVDDVAVYYWGDVGAGDTTPPSITNIVNWSITNSSVIINSTASEAANMTVKYGTTINLGTTAINTTSAINLSVTITGLTASTLYYYNVTRCDSSNNCNTSGPNNFTTTANDLTPPNITNVINWSITNSSVIINSTASELSNTTVCYGNTTALGSCVYNTSILINSSVTITGLTSNMTYYYNVTRVDVYGNANTSGPRNFTTNITVRVQVNTTLWEVNITNLQLQGNHSIESVWVNTTTGETLTNSTSLTFFVLGNLTSPQITLLGPANNTNFSSSSVVLNWTVTDDVTSPISCNLYTNSTGSLNITQSNNVTNGTNVSSNLTLTVGRYLWGVMCTDGVQTSYSGNRTFNVSFATGGGTNVSFCAGITRVSFRANLSGVNVSTNRTTQSQVANGVTNCLFQINTTGEASYVNVSAKLNATHVNYTVQLGGVNLTTGFQTILNVSANNLTYLNATGYWKNTTVSFYPFKITVRVT